MTKPFEWLKKISFIVPSTTQFRGKLKIEMWMQKIALLKTFTFSWYSWQLVFVFETFNIFLLKKTFWIYSEILIQPVHQSSEKSVICDRSGELFPNLVGLRALDLFYWGHINHWNINQSPGIWLVKKFYHFSTQLLLFFALELTPRYNTLHYKV